MNVKEIIEKYLRDNGYDGLCYADEECGCLLEDLIPCGEPCDQCVPGYNGADPSGEHDSFIYEKKEDAENAKRAAEEEE
jgi:hypothetical protein